MKKIVSVVIIVLTIVAAVYVLTAGRETNKAMIIKSPAFESNGQIPETYTCSGRNINPQLVFENVPAEAKSLALIVDDPDASRGVTFNHWLIWNIPASVRGIDENSVPPEALQGKNDAGKTGYSGPCPPPGKPHHYRFKLFALNGILNIPAGSSIEELEVVINGNLIEKAELVGIFERK